MTLSEVSNAETLQVLLLLICANFVLPTIAHQQIDVAVADIDKLLKDGLAATSLMNGEDCIVFVGTSGSGKSILSKFIRRDASIEIVKKGSEYIFNNNDDKTKNSLISKTFYPNVDIDPESGVHIIDLTGFQEPRISNNFDLVTTFWNKNILDTAKRIKIIIVEEYSSTQLNEQQSSFLSTLQHVSNLIETNLMSFNGSIGIVATKIESPQKDSRLIRSIKDFLEEIRSKIELERLMAEKNGDSKLSEDRVRQIHIVDFLLNDNNIALFRRPEELGSPWEIEPLANNYRDVRKLIFNKLQYSSTFADNKFRVAITTGTKIFVTKKMLPGTNLAIKDLLQEASLILLQKLNQTLATTMRPSSAKFKEVTRFCENYLEELHSLTTYDELQHFLIRRRSFIPSSLLDKMRFLTAKVNFINSIKLKNVVEVDLSSFKHSISSRIETQNTYYKFLAVLESEFDTYQMQVKMSRSRIMTSTAVPSWNITKMLLFFQTMDFGRAILNTTKLVPGSTLSEENLRDFKTLLLEKLTDQMSFVENKGVVTFHGNHIVFCSVMKVLKNIMKPTNIVVMASKIIYIDCNSVLNNTHLEILAPKIEIVGNRTFTLNGQNGKVHYQKKASKSYNRHENGENGLPGNNGFSSGSFRLFALNVVNGNLLRVKTTGGNGGNGQEGGNGFDARQSNFPFIPNLEGKNETYLSRATDLGYSVKFSDYFSDSLFALVYASNKDTYLLTVTNNQENAPPTNGGNGGNAGLGAKAGIQNYYIQNASMENAIECVFEDGKPGQSGIGGSQGKNAADCVESRYSCDCKGKFATFYWHSKYCYCSLIENVTCLTKYPEASEGSPGQLLGNEAVQIYLNEQTEFSGVINDYVAHLLQQSLHEIGVETKLFLEYLLSFKEQTLRLTLSAIIKFLHTIESNIKATLVGNQKEIHWQRNLRYIFTTIYEAFVEAKKASSENDEYVNIVDLTFISRLSTFSQNKQIVNLVSTVKNTIKDLSKMGSSLQSIGQMKTVVEEKNKLNKLVGDAERVIANFTKKQQEIVKSGVSANIKKLLDRTTQLKQNYSRNINDITQVHNELSKAVILNAVLGVTDAISTVSAVLWPPAAQVGASIAGFKQDITIANIDNYTPKLPKGLQNAKDIIMEMERERELNENTKRRLIVAALKEVAILEQDVGPVLSQISRKSVEDYISANDQPRQEIPETTTSDMAETQSSSVPFIEDQIEQEAIIEIPEIIISDPMLPEGAQYAEENNLVTDPVEVNTENYETTTISEMVENRSSIPLKEGHKVQVLEVSKNNTSKATLILENIMNELSKFLGQLNPDESPEKIDKMNSTINYVEYAQYLAMAGGIVVNIVNEYLKDSAKLEHLQTAISANRKAMKELSEFETSLDEHLRPMMSAMLEAFHSFETKGQDAFTLQFRKLDIKKFARTCISKIEQFTEGFPEETEGLRQILSDQQDFLTTVIEVTDKIHELQYRTQLVEFLGKMHGGVCSESLTTVPATCESYQSLYNFIQSNEITRKFVFVFTAYQQVLFPYGGAKMPVLLSTVAQVQKSDSLQQKTHILREALSNIAKDLSEIDDAIVNDKDKSIAIATFNSKYASSESFYTWSNSKHRDQIRALLSGERVTFVAPVSAPDVKNAVKFREVALNFTSPDPKVTRSLQETLKNFELLMVHSGESYYRCGANFYAITGEKFDLKMSFELDEKGEYVSRNKVFEKIKYGDVPLSPYTVWNFHLVLKSKANKIDLLEKLAKLTDKVNLEMIGSGYYVEEGAKICDTDLGLYYSYYNSGFLK